MLWVTGRLPTLPITLSKALRDHALVRLMGRSIYACGFHKISCNVNAPHIYNDYKKIQVMHRGLPWQTQCQWCQSQVAPRTPPAQRSPRTLRRSPRTPDR
jgi:hypothetical protein